LGTEFRPEYLNIFSLFGYGYDRLPGGPLLISTISKERTKIVSLKNRLDMLELLHAGVLCPFCLNAIYTTYTTTH